MFKSTAQDGNEKANLLRQIKFLMDALNEACIRVSLDNVCPAHYHGKGEPQEASIDWQHHCANCKRWEHKKRINVTKRDADCWKWFFLSCADKGIQIYKERAHD